MPKVWAVGARGRDEGGCSRASNQGDGGAGFRERSGGTGGAGDPWTRKLREHLRGCAAAAGVLRFGGVLVVPVEKSAWLRLLGATRPPPPPPEPERSASPRRPRRRRARATERREAGRGGAEEGEGEAQAPPRKAQTQSRLDSSQGGPLGAWVRAKDRLARRERAEARRRRRAEREERRRKEREAEERARESERRVSAWAERKRREAGEARRRGTAGAEPDRRAGASSGGAVERPGTAITPAEGTTSTAHPHGHSTQGPRDFLSHDAKVTSPAPQAGHKETLASQRGRSQRRAGQSRALQMGPREGDETEQAEEKNPGSSLSPDYLDMSTAPPVDSRAGEEPAAQPEGVHSDQQGVLTSQTNASSKGGHQRETYDGWLRRKAKERRRRKEKEEEEMRRSEEGEQDPKLEEAFVKLARRRLEAKLKGRRRVDSGLSAPRNLATRPRQQSATVATSPVEGCLPEVLYQNALRSALSELKSSRGLPDLSQIPQPAFKCPFPPNSKGRQRKAGARQQPISCLTGPHRDQRKGGA